MSSKNTAVFGIYATPATAEAAVDHLLAHGFTNSAISVLLPDDESTRAFAHEKNTKAPEGTATGVTAGGVVGGTLGLLAGIGALKRLSVRDGEVKSMHTVEAMRGQGVGSAMLSHIVASARAIGMARLYLETGSWSFFAPARAF